MLVFVNKSEKEGCNAKKNRRKAGFYRWVPWQKSGGMCRNVIIATCLVKDEFGGLSCEEK